MNVPWKSFGFWVAMTKNGRGTGRDTPSAVTWRSSITSSSADCVFGLPRLISSPISTLVNTGPSRKRKLPLPCSYTITPVMSLGSRSGVNWTRFQVPAIDPAIALASVVLPVPGTSSSSRWPSVSMQHMAMRISWCLPFTTPSMFLTIASTTSAMSPSTPPSVGVQPTRGRGVRHLLINP